MKTLIAIIQIPFFLHRIVFALGATDGLVLFAISLAVYLHIGWVWALYGITVGAVVALYKILADVATWVSAIATAKRDQADAMRTLARSVRDKKLSIHHGGHISNR